MGNTVAFNKVYNVEDAQRAVYADLRMPGDDLVLSDEGAPYRAAVEYTPTAADLGL